jgi:hypothetical protein
MKKIRISGTLLGLLFLLTVFFSNAAIRKIAILDVTTKNAERNYFKLETHPFNGICFVCSTDGTKKGILKIAFN